MTAEAARLRRIVEEAAPRLASLAHPEHRPSDERWSPIEILGHLIDSASNNHQRFVRAQLDSRLEFPGYTQDRWTALQQYQSESWDNLLALWISYNRHLAHVISAIPAGAQPHACSIGGRDPVALGFLVTDYIHHLEHHLAQIAAISPAGTSSDGAV